MSDAERAAVVERVGAVVTCEGRALSLHNTLMLVGQRSEVSVVGRRVLAVEVRRPSGPQE